MSDPQKAFSFKRASLPDPLTRGSAPAEPPLGALPPYPVIGSYSALAMVRAPPLFIQVYAYGPIQHLQMARAARYHKEGESRALKGRVFYHSLYDTIRHL